MTTYQCNACGKISTDKSQICDSKEEITSFWICDSCNKHSTDKDTLCNPAEVAPAFYCGKCGTSHIEQTKLCEPVRL